MMIWIPLEQRGESLIIVRIDLITNCGFYIIVFLTENLSSGGNRLQKYRECFCKGTVGSFPGFPTNSGSGSIYGGNEQVSFQLWTILQIDGSRREKTRKKDAGVRLIIFSYLFVQHVLGFVPSHPFIFLSFLLYSISLKKDLSHNIAYLPSTDAA